MTSITSISMILVLACLCACETTNPTPTNHASKPAPAKARPEQSSAEPSFDSRVARLKIGMSREQVNAIMGNNGTQSQISRSAQGTVQSVRYSQDFGNLFATSAIRYYSSGFAGRERSSGVNVVFINGRASHINPY